MTTEKQCRDCHETLPLSEFRRNKGCWRTQCRSCERAWQAEYARRAYKPKRPPPKENFGAIRELDRIVRQWISETRTAA